jgi:hypothetical protein
MHFCICKVNSTDVQNKSIVFWLVFCYEERRKPYKGTVPEHHSRKALASAEAIC